MYLGRRDHRGKIRSARVELGEVETALADMPAVARPDAGGYLVLLAFVTLRQGALADLLARWGILAQTLPDYTWCMHVLWCWTRCH